MSVYADGSKQNVLLMVEVKSSPMLWTERKAILGVANMVRRLRNTSDSVQKFTSFAFPNINDCHCIAEIQVTWLNFMFVS